MFDPPHLVPWASFDMNVVDSAEHRALAREAAAKSVVLLQNRKATIPIDLTATAAGTARRKHIAVIGPNANRTESLLSNYAGCRDTPGGPIDATCRLITPLAGISAAATKAGATVEFAQVSRKGPVELCPARWLVVLLLSLV
jgi:beta-glucosidase-like glycosyl hydrolase